MFCPIYATMIKEATDPVPSSSGSSKDSDSVLRYMSNQLFNVQFSIATLEGEMSLQEETVLVSCILPWQNTTDWEGQVDIYFYQSSGARSPR